MYREEILGYIEDQFMGPSYGEPHVLKHNKDYLPYQHLITGMLFPQESDLSESARRISFALVFFIYTKL